MCSIFGSYKLDEFKKLAQLNQARGKHAWSFTEIGQDGVLTQAGPGEMPDVTGSKINPYYLGHVQTPTTTDGNKYIHPASNGIYHLYHNGILRDVSGWDTQYLLDAIVRDGLGVLSDINGSFSCVLYSTRERKVYMFRNSSAPMYMLGSTISSVRFPGSTMTRAGVIYSLRGKLWIDGETFRDNDVTYKV